MYVVRNFFKPTEYVNWTTANLYHIQVELDSIMDFNVTFFLFFFPSYNFPPPLLILSHETPLNHG